MPTNINDAFRSFLSDNINLAKSDSDAAKQDRINLITRIDSLQSVAGFPTLLADKHVHFGSFSRKTKKRPLDDVDMMFCMSAEGATYDEYAGNSGVSIYINDTASNLYKLTNDDNLTLNSVKVLNKFKIELGKIYQYRSSEINTRQEAVRLQLTTRNWSFDIVPCFHSDTDLYFIPDGSGRWKKTDPRIDQKRVSSINQSNKGNVLNVIRIIKFWNSRPTMPTISSYLLEVMILEYYQYRTETSSYVDLEIPSIFEFLSTRVYSSVNDPKGLQGDLNDLTFDQKMKISERAAADGVKAREARLFESSDMQECFRKWRQVFGDSFPAYG